MVATLEDYLSVRNYVNKLDAWRPSTKLGGRMLSTFTSPGPSSQSTQLSSFLLFVIKKKNIKLIQLNSKNQSLKKNKQSDFKMGMYTYGWFLLMYGRNQPYTVKQLSSNYK